MPFFVVADKYRYYCICWLINNKVQYRMPNKCLMQFGTWGCIVCLTESTDKFIHQFWSMQQFSHSWIVPKSPKCFTFQYKKIRYSSGLIEKHQLSVPLERANFVMCETPKYVVLELMQLQTIYYQKKKSPSQIPRTQGDRFKLLVLSR